MQTEMDHDIEHDGTRLEQLICIANVILICFRVTDPYNPDRCGLT